MNIRPANRILVCLQGIVSRIPFGRKSADVRSILAIRWGNVGDTIVMIPAFRALRRIFPDARIVLLTTPTYRGLTGAEEILENDPTFDEIIVYYKDQSRNAPYLLELRRQICALRVDLAVMFVNQRSTIGSLVYYLLFLTTASVRNFIGFRLFESNEYHLRQVERQLDVIRPLGHVQLEKTPWLQILNTAQRAVDQRLKNIKRPIIVMHCGAKAPVNRWPLERFAEVGKRLVTECNATILFTGSLAERGETQKVVGQVGTNCLNLAGDTNIQELIALITTSDLVISNDTGAMHIAYAQGRPLVAVFSAHNHPMVWRPIGPNYVVLREEPECSPCHSDVCPLYDEPRCILSVTSAQVYDAAIATLDRSPAGQRSSSQE